MKKDGMQQKLETSIHQLNAVAAFSFPLGGAA